MSEDEFFILAVSAGAGGALALHWYRLIYLSPISHRAVGMHIGLGVMPLVALAFVFAVIAFAGSYDVRGEPQYLLLYSVLGAVWIFLGSYMMHWLGISFRDDAVERRNPAAAIVVISSMAAHAAIYAGANIGDGPGWWCVVAAALIGSGAWFLLWLLVEVLCAASDEITVERNVPEAIRLGGYAVATGLVCARGSAGDWTSLSQTFIEFQSAWPAVPLTVAAIALELLVKTRPRADRLKVPTSMCVAATYIVAAVVAVSLSDPLPQNPQYALFSN